MRTRPWLAAAAVLVVLGACTPVTAGGRARVADATAQVTGPAATAVRSQVPAKTDDKRAMVELGDHFYSPDVLRIRAGTTVTWKMVGSQEHDVVAYDGSFHSHRLGPGDSFSYMFTKPGRYAYFCVPHYGDGMYGLVVVE